MKTNNIINRIHEVAQGMIAAGVEATKAFELATQAVALEQAQVPAPAAPVKPTGAPAPKEQVAYKKVDNTVVMCSPAQAAAYEARKTHSDEERAAKPQTKREAIAAWKAEKGIEPVSADARAEYKRLYDANWLNDWNAWANSPERKALSKSERKVANEAKAKAIRNGYRKQAGMPESAYEK